MRIFEIGPDDPTSEWLGQYEWYDAIPAHLLRDDKSWAATHRWEIKGLRKWLPPHVTCPECDVTWQTQEDYPQVDVSHLPGIAEWSWGAALPLARMRELQRQLAPCLPEGRTPRPGAGFGPLVGKVVGDIGDFGWHGSWAVVTPRRVFEALLGAGVTGLLAAPTELKYREEIVELYAPLRVALARRALGIPEGPACETCGRLGITRPSPMIIDPSSVPERDDLTRGIEMSNTLFGSERFALAARSLELRNIRFHEVAIEGQPPPGAEPPMPPNPPAA